MAANAGHILIYSVVRLITDVPSKLLKKSQINVKCGGRHLKSGQIVPGFQESMAVPAEFIGGVCVVGGEIQR
jgi:hypothetical protein